MRYNVADVEVVFNVAHGGGPRGAEPPRGEAESVAKASPLGGSTEGLSAPLPPHAPLPTETGGSGGPPGPLAGKPAPGVVGGPVRG
jgi:hypothetical protein